MIPNGNSTLKNAHNVRWWSEQAGTSGGCNFGWSRKGNVSSAVRSLNMKATGTSITCKGEWMAEAMHCRIWFCYTRTVIGKSINKVGDLRNRVP